MLSRILREQRLKADLTQQAVAEKLNVTRQAVSSWETGKSYPDIPTLILLSDFYDLSLDYLLKGDEQYLKKITKDTDDLVRLRKLTFVSYLGLGILLPLLLLLLFTQAEKNTQLWQLLYLGVRISILLLFGFIFFQLKKAHKLNSRIIGGVVLILLSLLLTILKAYFTIPAHGFIMFGSSLLGSFLLISGSMKKGRKKATTS